MEALVKKAKALGRRDLDKTIGTIVAKLHARRWTRAPKAELDELGHELTIHQAASCLLFTEEFCEPKTEEEAATWTGEELAERLAAVLGECWGLVALHPGSSVFNNCLNEVANLSTGLNLGREHYAEWELLQSRRGHRNNVINTFGQLGCERVVRAADRLVEHFLAKREGSFSDLVCACEAYAWAESAEGEKATTHHPAHPPSVSVTALSHRHLVAIRNARHVHGVDFLGPALGALVQEALRSLCWSTQPPTQDDEWLHWVVNDLTNFVEDECDDRQEQDLLARLPVPVQDRYRCLQKESEDRRRRFTATNSL
jgi:hypothetical protein